MSAAAQIASRPARPYPGLEPYSEDRADLFFGRDRERDIIIANLRTSRLTLLYGASGVGKTSLLRAGVAHSLRNSDAPPTEDGLPAHVVVLFARWAGDPAQELAAAIRAAVNRVVSGAVPSEGSIVETLEAARDAYAGEVLVIADQLDEFFVYHPNQDPDAAFGVQLGQAVARRDLRANFLVSIREDAIAKLDVFKGRIPGLFESRLRVDHLTRAGGEAAIREPLRRWNEQRGDGAMAIDDELVHAVLEQVEVGKVTLGQAGVGQTRADRAPADARVQAPFLQLVMTRLWDEEVGSGSQRLRRTTLANLGEAIRIIHTHLYAALDDFSDAEQEVAAKVLRHLVTPSGTKIAHSAADLAAYAELSEKEVEPLLERLSSTTRVLRKVAASQAGGTVERYEIFHDALAPAVLDWLDQHQHIEELATVEQKRLELEAAFKDAPERVTFPELARAQFAYDRELDVAGIASSATEVAHRVRLAVFERTEGRIVDSYWPRSAAGGVVVTKWREDGSASLARLVRNREPVYALHRSTEAVTREAPQLEDVLQRCTAVALRARATLAGEALHTVMQALFSIAQRNLALADRFEGRPPDEPAYDEAERSRHELAQVERRLERAADRTGRVVYAAGMLLGLLVLASILVLAILVLSSGAGAVGTLDLSRRLLAAAAGGAVGAVVSVLTRMSRGRFGIDFDLGRRGIRLVAALRPFVGAAIGVLAAFAFEATVVYYIDHKSPSTRVEFLERAPYIVALAAFVTGFLERWLDILGGRRPVDAESAPPFTA